MALERLGAGFLGSRYAVVPGLLFLVSLVCLATRFRTGLTYRRAKRSAAAARSVPVLPYWIPWLGHAVQFAIRFQDFLADARARHCEDTFAILVGGTKFNIVVSPSLTKDILNLRSEITNHPFIIYVMKKFWNDRGTTSQINPDTLWKSIHPVLYQLTREPSLSTAVHRTVESVEEVTHNLVSFNSSLVDQAPWERSSNVVVLPAPTKVAEASLYPLIRDFVGDLACSVLMGRDFQANYPNVLEDLWLLDSKMNGFLMGVPSWIPGMRAPAAARERVVDAVASHHKAVSDMMDGKDPGTRWSDDLLTDCSRVMVDRVKAYKDAASDPRAAACGDAAILWAMMVNANQVVFWMVFHVYSEPELLEQIRQEISAFVKVEDSKSSFPIKPPVRLSIDIRRLQKECPLLEATFFETMRLNTLSSSTKIVQQDFTMTESLADAQMQGRSMPYTYLFRKGDLILVPHALHQDDVRYWPEPEKFEPRRFWVENEKREGPGRPSVEYKTMKVWGGGASMCKGRGFAEAEVIVFAAAIFAMWDIEPVDGVWKNPGHASSGGTAKRKKDIRVRLRRRA